MNHDHLTILHHTLLKGAYKTYSPDSQLLAHTPFYGTSITLMHISLVTNIVLWLLSLLPSLAPSFGNVSLE
jgi:hypothetical protein